MRKSYFLMTILLLLFASSFTTIVGNLNDDNSNVADNNPEINIPDARYLNLSYKNGAFYSWDQTDNDEQHIIGIFSTDDQSFLLDNFGVFWSLDYQIINFSRINETKGIAEIKYFQAENKREYFNKNFLIELNQANKNITMNNTPLAIDNTNITVLNENYAVASGVGLELIDISNPENINYIIPAYENDETFPTSFYRINDDSGIFVNDDQYFYLVTNISSGNVTKTKIELEASLKDDVVVIDDNHLVIRDEDNILYFAVIEGTNVTFDPWGENDNNFRTSKAKNVAFRLTDDTFIVNFSFVNSSSEYGAAYLVKINDWKTLIDIPNLKTISNLMFTDENSGILVDKDLTASNFIYQSDNDSFDLATLGTLNNFQFINKNLIYGSIKEDNLLISKNLNQMWALRQNVQFNLRNINSSDNLLNHVIRTKDEEEINYQNTYFANGSANLTITDAKLIQVTIASSSGQRILKPTNNTVDFAFLAFDTYQVEINFTNDGVEDFLTYQVKIVNFAEQKLLAITGSDIISYVGSAKKNLYDIKAIDSKNAFTINDYNYDYLQYAELAIYDDAKDIVTRNVYKLQENSEIKINTLEPDLFYGVKTINLLNQVNWTYLGFIRNNVLPMADFWDSPDGQDLMKQALMHRYLERDLRKISAEEINKLMIISDGWYSIAIQGKATVITIISIFVIALISIIAAISSNVYLNKKIAIVQVEQNRILKNPFDL